MPDGPNLRALKPYGQMPASATMRGRPTPLFAPEYPRPLPGLYPEFSPLWPHPFVRTGLNVGPMGGIEVNGAAPETAYATYWDDITLGRPTIVGAPGNSDPNVPYEYGQTVDMWVAREKRLAYVPRDRDRVRAEGYRGTNDGVDYSHPLYPSGPIEVPPDPAPLQITGTKYTIAANDPKGTVAGVVRGQGGTPPYTITLIDNDQGNFKLIGDEVQTNKPTRSAGSHKITLSLTDSVPNTVSGDVFIEVVP